MYTSATSYIIFWGFTIESATTFFGIHINPLNTLQYSMNTVTRATPNSISEEQLICFAH